MDASEVFPPCSQVLSKCNASLAYCICNQVSVFNSVSRYTYVIPVTHNWKKKIRHVLMKTHKVDINMSVEYIWMVSKVRVILDIEPYHIVFSWFSSIYGLKLEECISFIKLWDVWLALVRIWCLTTWVLKIL